MPLKALLYEAQARCLKTLQARGSNLSVDDMEVCSLNWDVLIRVDVYCFSLWPPSVDWPWWRRQHELWVIMMPSYFILIVFNKFRNRTRHGCSQICRPSKQSVCWDRTQDQLISYVRTMTKILHRQFDELFIFIWSHARYEGNTSGVFAHFSFQDWMVLACTGKHRCVFTLYTHSSFFNFMSRRRQGV